MQSRAGEVMMSADNEPLQLTGCAGR